MDLRTALNCIEAQKQNKTYDGAKIGIVKQDFPGEFPVYKEGEIILFREELVPPFTQMGEYQGMKQKPRGTLTVEKPYSQEKIEECRREGSLITTVCTTVNVPEIYIGEILM